jgi:hypothetical protein
MRRKSIMAVLLGFMVASSVFASNIRTMKINWIGCDTKDNYRRALDMMIDKDWEAVARLMVSGQCIQLDEGTTVYMENATFTGWAQVRLKGQVTGWWTNYEHLSK